MNFVPIVTSLASIVISWWKTVISLIKTATNLCTTSNARHLGSIRATTASPTISKEVLIRDDQSQSCGPFSGPAGNARSLYPDSIYRHRPNPRRRYFYRTPRRSCALERSWPRRYRAQDTDARGHYFPRLLDDQPDHDRCFHDADRAGPRSARHSGA